jgi:serine/threonine-protein kinase
MTDASPSQIGKYEIVGVIGEGAMGTVYRAVDSVIGRTVAVKVMNAAIARDKGHRQRFLREAQAAGSLQHPNVVTIFDLGEIDGHLFIAMEFLHGVDLEKLMAGPDTLKLQSKLDIIVDVLMGLGYAHKNGIIHRDIKPANIRVSDDGKAKIMDFGVAHLASSDMTRTGLVVGTPSYMAPEQVTGGDTVPGTDIFAVGAVLYHLLTGSKPFEAPTLQSLFYRIVTDMPRQLDEVRPGLPPALSNIIQKAMAKDPANRYASALDMANEIIGVRAGLSGNPYAPTASLTATILVPPEPVKITTEPKWKRFAIPGAAAAVLLVGWMAYAATRDNGNDRPAIVTTDTAVAATDSVKAVAPEAPTETVAPVPAAPVVAEREDPEPPPTKAQKKQVTRTPQRVQPPPSRVADTKKGNERRPAPPPPPPPPRVAPPVVTVQTPRDTPARPVVINPAPAPVRQVESPPAPARPAPNPREEITTAVAAYARAIESRDIGAVRRAYPGMTSDQARGFEQFFQSARNINVTFRVTNVEVSGNAADATLTGTYEYVTSDGRSERQPVSFSASLRNDGSSWQLRSVR